MTLSALVKNACISVVITLSRIKVLESILSIYLNYIKSWFDLCQTSPELRRERQNRMSENGTVNIMDPPLLIPKLKKISELIQHADSDIVDLLGLPTSEKGVPEKI